MARVLNPTSTIKISLGIQPNGRVQKFFTHECRRRMDKYVPMDTGMLRDNVRESSDYIEYNQPYANYQYKGVSTNGKAFNYTTPGTGSYWDKKMMSAEGQQLVETVQRYVEGK